MSEPQEDHISVVAGADLDVTYDMWDNLTGAPPDWGVGTWEVTCDVRDNRGALLAHLANFGARDGDVYLLDGGKLRLLLAGSFTATLPITRTYVNSTDPRIATFRHRGVLFFTMIATETESGDVSDPIQGSLTVSQP
jgi:hypothetical protein